jgi:eukaryotic-like serine/threonine-protein kinase
LTPERWAQIEELFHRAAECEAQQRTALLDQACGSDRELRREIEALLASEGSARDRVQAIVCSELHGFGFSLVGKVVSHYRILDGLGGGGMGLVYRAEDIRLGRQVALKFLPEGSAKDPTALARFEREARAASALEHPNICPIYEFGEQDGQPFLVMPLLEGQTLRELLESQKAEPSRDDASVPQTKRHALELDQVLDLAIQIANGLDAAHQKGIIHRDIKPANIFVTGQGQAKILDFGLAKLARSAKEGANQPKRDSEDGSANRAMRETAPLVTSGSLLSQTGVAMGTEGYMSPEQVRGEKLDARTDLFSFGLVLYEMATGRQPFRGDDLQAIHDAVLHSQPPSPLVWNPKLPAELEAIIGKALAKDREQRYRSAGEIISELKAVQRAALERVFPDQDIAKQAAPLLTSQSRRLRWSKLASAGVAGLVLLAAAVFVAQRWTAEHRGVHPPKMEIARLTDSGRAEEVAISPDGRYVAYVQRELNGSALRVREMASGSDIQVLPPEVIHLWGLTFSPDGTHLYFVRPDENDPGFRYLYVMPALGGEARRMVTDIDTPVSFSPNGRQFVYTRGIPTQYTTEVRIANADGSENRLLATVTDAFPTTVFDAATWSPDGRTIAVPLFRFRRKPRYMLYTIDSVDGSVHELYASPNSIGRAMWLPGGNKVLSVLGDREGLGQLWTIGYPQGDVDRITDDVTNYQGNVDLTRNAATLAAIEAHVVSSIWSVPGVDAPKAIQLTSLSMPMYQVRELPNRKLLANGRKLWVLDADGKQRMAFTERSNVNALAVCGNFVVLTSEVNDRSEMLRFDLDGSRPQRLASGEFGDLSCTYDGKFVFYFELGPPQKIFRISVSGGTPVEIAQVLGEDAVSRLSLSPDGKTLLYAYEEFNTLKVKLAIVPVGGGPPLRTLDAPGELYESGLLLWSPTGKSVEYMLTQNGASNIWDQPLEGGTPRRLTNFNSGQIFDFDWSADGKRLLLCRGEVSSDVVLLNHLH